MSLIKEFKFSAAVIILESESTNVLLGGLDEYTSPVFSIIMSSTFLPFVVEHLILLMDRIAEKTANFSL